MLPEGLQWPVAITDVGGRGGRQDGGASLGKLKDEMKNTLMPHRCYAYRGKITQLWRLLNGGLTDMVPPILDVGGWMSVLQSPGAWMLSTEQCRSFKVSVFSTFFKKFIQKTFLFISTTSSTKRKS